jgi:hypothetical protein
MSDGPLVGPLAEVRWKMPEAAVVDSLDEDDRSYLDPVRALAQVQWYAGKDRVRAAGGTRGGQQLETTFDWARVKPEDVRGGLLVTVGGREQGVRLHADDVRESGWGFESDEPTLTIVKWEARRRGESE